MMFMHLTRSWATIILLTVFAVSLSYDRAGAGLIVNGGFEEPDLSTSFDTLSGTDLTGWTVTSGSVDLIHTYWPAIEGDQSLDLAGSTSDGGQIEQSFTTEPGKTYELEFQYANNIDRTSSTGSVEVFGSSAVVPLLSETLVHAGSSSASVAAMNYTPFSGTFTADSATTTLRFTHVTSTPTDPGNFGIALDAVDVNAVPEPAAALLLAAGLLIMGVGREKRTAKVHTA